MNKIISRILVIAVSSVVIGFTGVSLAANCDKPESWYAQCGGNGGDNLIVYGHSNKPI